MIMLLVRTSLLAIIIGTPAAYAQEAVGPIIIVTGKALDQTKGDPAYGSVEIDRARLTSEASGRIENVLADVAGFQQFRRSDSRSANPSAQGATLRALGGNASSRTLVLLDGVPQADPFFGYIPFSALVPDRLSAVRITRGGGSGAFGAGATIAIQVSFSGLVTVTGTPELALNTTPLRKALYVSGAGGSTLEAGLRLNYRVSPQFSPYVGYVWEKTYGRSGDWLREEGEHDEEGAWVLGLKFWL